MNNNELIMKMVQELREHDLKIEQLGKLINSSKENNYEVKLLNNTHIKVKNNIDKIRKKIQFPPKRVEPTLSSENNFIVINDKTETGVEFNPENNNLQNKINIKEKFSKIKSMIACHLVDIGRKHAFLKNNDFSFKNIISKVGLNIKSNLQTLPLAYEDIKKNFLNHAEKMNVKVESYINESQNIKNLNNNIKNNSNRVYENLFLFGEKKTIARLKNSFSVALKTVGFEASDLVYYHSKKEYLSIEDVHKNINKKLEQTLNLKEEASNYILPTLNNLGDDIKSEIIIKMIWPKIMEHTKEALNLTKLMTKARLENPYFKIVTDFANKNSLSVETVVSTLDKSPNLLKEYKGFDKLNKLKENILMTTEKYEILSRNNFIVLKSLVKAGSNLQQIINLCDIPQEQKDTFLNNMYNTPVGTNENKDKKHTFETIQKEVNKLLENKNFINEIHSSNKKLNSKKELQEIKDEIKKSTSLRI